MVVADLPAGGTIIPVWTDEILVPFGLFDFDFLPAFLRVATQGAANDCDQSKNRQAKHDRGHLR